MHWFVPERRRCATICAGPSGLLAIKRVGSPPSRAGLLIAGPSDHSVLSIKIHEGPSMKHSEGFLNLVNDAKSRIREVTVDETRERMKANDAVRLIDVREDNEWQEAHAPGAEHLGKGIIERDIEEKVPDKATEIILYCGGGFRSALATDVLQKMGYRNVFSMAGGWKAWNESGAPTEEG